MNNYIYNWLINWFTNKNPQISININNETDYYKAGLVDSFGIIELIVEIENNFSIKFDDSDFKKKEFRTIKGLENLIKSRMNL